MEMDLVFGGMLILAIAGGIWNYMTTNEKDIYPWVLVFIAIPLWYFYL
tara:strand:+ start:51 stop:194 length:144 start_codon:yes stop_codon:yes gene_type:complete